MVGSDATAQSDIYSAITLAGVVGTDCVVLAGSRDSSMPASQQALFGDAAATGGYVLRSAAAVPDAKLAGRHMTRLGGTTRWETAQLAGQRASGDITAGTDTAAETIQEEGQDGGGSESDEEAPVKDSEQNNSETLLLNINANPVWAAELRMIDDFAKDCGFHETNESGTGYRECHDSDPNLACVLRLCWSAGARLIGVSTTSSQNARCVSRCGLCPSGGWGLRWRRGSLFAMRCGGW